MAMTDTIADMLTRIRNASTAKLPVVDIPASNLKRDIARVLQEKGFIKKFVVVDDGKQGILKVLLRYTKGESAIQGLRRVSVTTLTWPSFRAFATASAMLSSPHLKVS